MKIIAWSQNLNRGEGEGGRRRLVDKDTRFREGDFVCIHTVLSTAPRLVTARELGLMKKTAYLINTRAGPIVDERRADRRAGAGRYRRRRARCLCARAAARHHPFRS